MRDGTLAGRAARHDSSTRARGFEGSQCLLPGWCPCAPPVQNLQANVEEFASIARIIACAWTAGREESDCVSKARDTWRELRVLPPHAQLSRKVPASLETLLLRKQARAPVT